MVLGLDQVQHEFQGISMPAQAAYDGLWKLFAKRGVVRDGRIGRRGNVLFNVRE